MLTQLGGASIRLVQADRGTASLRNNVAHHVGDDFQLVKERRQLLASEFERPILWMNQTHSHVIGLVVMTADGHPTLNLDTHTSTLNLSDPMDTIEADGVIIDARGWQDAPGIAVMTADCLPIVLSTAGGTIVAAVHAGRKGLFDGIITRAVTLMRRLAPSRDIEAYIAPAICGDCYEVPAQMRDECAVERPESASRTSWGTPALDLPRAAQAELRALGCTRIEIDPRCTLEDPTLHSYRRDRECGRNATIIFPA